MSFSPLHYSISEDIFALVSLEHIVLFFSRYGISCSIYCASINLIDKDEYVEIEINFLWDW